ncbi:MAG: pyridoxal-dependent decarboxylase [Tumebacillaceae bacterium]
MEFKDVQRLFPSEDGNLDSQKHFLSLIEKLIVAVDKMKDPSIATLGESKERSPEFYGEVIEAANMPNTGVGIHSVVDDLINLLKGHPYQTRNWLANVMTMSSIPGILGILAAVLVNGNNIWDAHGPAGAEAEVRVISMMSKLVKYDYTRSWGYSTWGGQGATYAALRIAIAKQFPFAKEEGVNNNLYCFASEDSHYSLLKSIEATGIGSKNLIKIRSNPDQSMNTDDLHEKMTTVIKRGGIPICVVATMGTTDSFGIDDLAEIRRVTDEVCQTNGLRPVHIHGDSAMGGFYAVFNDYDFDKNPHDYEPDVLEGVKRITERMQHLNLADSLCFDFHKLGQTPYQTSLFLLKNGKDLTYVDLKEFDTPYIGNRSYGSYHTSYTLECSRMASSISMYSALMALGIEGYQRLLANYVRVNNVFRRRVEEVIPSIAVTNGCNPGPVTLFRLYPGSSEWAQELAGEATSEQIERNNEMTYYLFEALGRERSKLFFGDTKKQCLVEVTDSKTRYPIYATKLFTISPYTEVDHVEYIVNYLKQRVDVIQGATAEAAASSEENEGCMNGS